jgi:predicted DsbA family dithiol-disulfide isomerase
MEAIKLESNVGQCGFRIAFKINKQKLASKASKIAGYVIWHDVASAMHAGGKKAEFSAASPYSPELSARAVKEGEKVLGEFFDDITIETFEKVKETPESKFLAWAKKLGLDEAKTREALASAKPNGEVKAEEKPSETLE